MINFHIIISVFFLFIPPQQTLNINMGDVPYIFIYMLLVNAMNKFLWTKFKYFHWNVFVSAWINNASMLKISLYSEIILSAALQVHFKCSACVSKAIKGTVTFVLQQWHLVSQPTETKKAPDTHIKNMQPELRELVIQELSLYKNSGTYNLIFVVYIFYQIV